MDDLEQSIPKIASLKDERDNFAAATGQSNHEVFAALIDYLRPKAVSMRKWKEEKTLRQMCETKGNFYHASFRQITLTSFFCSCSTSHWRFIWRACPSLVSYTSSRLA